MKINLSKDQYKQLIELIAISNGLLGVLGDALPDSNYKKRSKKMDDLESYLLQSAKEFGCPDLAQYDSYDGKVILDDEYYENEIYPILEDYEDFAVHDTLSNKLAWRDFHNDHTEAEIEKMRKENNGYFGVPLYDYEKKYWDEFDKYGYDRLVVKKDK